MGAERSPPGSGQKPDPGRPRKAGVLQALPLSSAESRLSPAPKWRERAGHAAAAGHMGPGRPRPRHEDLALDRRRRKDPPSSGGAVGPSR
ncbi:hypothetical protein J1605_023322 [Eschrichtius robustus]|uniref:Uncharacterized protein n=1 Tax=Eschrichtius robustus TaxID=9764 RepID=A0AB34H7J4_ESCRO|nr:hypothetical protein J1605_023322 [Eschrichtius robustus]